VSDPHPEVNPPEEAERPSALSPRGLLVSPWLLGTSAVLVALVGFMFGILAERDVFSQGGIAIGGKTILSAEPDAGNFDQLEEVRALIDAEYYYLPDDPAAREAFDQKLEYDAIRGMTEGLQDDYTAFLPPSEQAPVAEQMSGEYDGIGVWVEYPDGKFQVVSPMPGSPAESAGIKAGDIILEADGHPLTGIGEEAALLLLRGPAGTSVTLTIQRLGVDSPITLQVVRDKIATPAVFYEFLPESGVARIQVTVFGDKTTEQLDAAIKSAHEDGATGIVLDLRNNGGGWVESAQDMIGRFVPPERGVALYEDTNPQDDHLDPEPIKAGSVTEYNLPLVVLVNDGTASASEIVAGALRDYGRAKIVGTETFGKGSVQHVHDFKDGSSARITFAEWLTPSKTAIQGQGLLPDLYAENPAANSPQDTQLQAAIDVLIGRSTKGIALPSWWP
jgi:carboxyl-terminal processing protease